MVEQKKFDTKHKIHIKLCLTLAKHGFKFLGTEDLLLVVGFCQECGHPIRYEQHFMDVQDGNEYIIGSNCMFKIYILSHWRTQIKDKDLENKHLQRAGKWLWIIHRDGYLEKMDERLPQPEDYDDFKQLADDLKIIVLSIRTEIKNEIAKEKRQKKLEEYIKSQPINVESNQNWLESQCIDINKCNDWEKDFLKTMYIAYNKHWSLSDKQENIFNRIKSEKSIDRVVGTSKNLAVSIIVNKIPENLDYSKLNDWEKEFMESIERIVDLGHVLSEKQLEILDKIDEKLSNDEKIEDYSIYIGKKIKSWVIADITGHWVSGTVKSVKGETDLAILCEVSVGNELIIDEVWIPKSALLEEVSL